MLERSRSLVSASIVVVTTMISGVCLAANVDTVAGSGARGFNGDGPALGTDLNGPRGIAVAPDGTIYFADSRTFLIRKVTTGGQIVTVAGTAGSPGDSGDDGLATAAQISGVVSVAIDPSGSSLYFGDVDNSRVRVVDLTTGLIHAFAGVPGGFSYGGDGGFAVNAFLALPEGVSVGGDGSVYIADVLNCVIRRVDTTGFISTVAGDFNCPATGALGLLPRRVIVDANDNLYVLDANANVVNRVDHSTGAITAIAGGGGVTPGFGNATDMNLAGAQDISLDSDGNLYVNSFSQVFKVDLAASFLNLFAGNGGIGFSGDGGPANNATFADVSGVTAHGTDVVISDAGNNRLRAVTPAPAIPTDVIIDALTSQGVLDSLTSVGGNVIVVDFGGTQLLITSLANIDGDFTSHQNTLVVIDLSSLTTVGGSIDISGDQLKELDLPLLSSVEGDLTLANSPLTNGVLLTGVNHIGGDLTIVGTAATAIDLRGLVTAGGSIDISGNTSAGTIDLRSLTTAVGSISIVDDTSASTIDITALTSAGNVNLSGDTAATAIDLRSLTTTGNVAINGDTSAGAIDLRSLTGATGTIDITNDVSAGLIDISSLTNVGGAINLVGDTSLTSIDISGLASAGNIDISGNTSLGPIDLTNLGTVGGDISIVGNSSNTSVDLGSLTSVGGNVTIETSGTGAFDMGTGAVGGDINISTNGNSGVGGRTGGGATNVTMTTPDAIMRLRIQSASFAVPVNFSIARLDPTALVPETGTASDGGPASVDPIAAYQFNFTTPILNRTASLSFDVNVAALDTTTQAQLLNALAAGTATIVTRPDGVGTQFQSFAVCKTSESPTPGGCVQIDALDASGNPTTGTPATVRFSNLVGHFSTWGVAEVVPTEADTCPVPSADLCTDETGFTSVYQETIVRVPNTTYSSVRSFTSNAVSNHATVVIHNNGCASAAVRLNGTDIDGLVDLPLNGACFTRDVAVNQGNNDLTIVVASSQALLQAACRGGGGGGHREGEHDHRHHHGDDDGDDDDHDGDDDHGVGHHHHGEHHGHGHHHHHGGEGEGEGAAGEGEGEGASAGEGEGEGGTAGEGEGEGGTAGEGEGEGGTAGEGEGEGGTAGEGEGEGGTAGEGEGEGAPADQGCSITVSIEELTQCPAPSASTPQNNASCDTAGSTPAALSVLALAVLALRRRKR